MVHAPLSIVLGDQRPALYLPLLEGRRVALFSNHTGLVGGRHILDVLLDQGVDVTAIFSPEHGFRGTADAGEHVASRVDPQTGIPILSLYNGRDPRPSAESMGRFDVLVVDIQDVGLRFYTYYITMCRLMDACAEHGKAVVVLDRPNPNGHYVDGPVLERKHRSGVGQLPIPIVHGMTLGELALMVQGEGWLTGGRTCELTVVPCLGYTHATPYTLTVAPSPNLPCQKAVLLYPSTCLFEGTVMSLGRGTDRPFQVYGHPDLKGSVADASAMGQPSSAPTTALATATPTQSLVSSTASQGLSKAHADISRRTDVEDCTFTPHSRPGAKQPPLEGKACRGVDLTGISDETLRQEGRIRLCYLIDAYRRMGIGDRFFTAFFEKLVGVDYVRQMIEAGCSEDEIRARWQPDVEAFKQVRAKYLLYE